MPEEYAIDGQPVVPILAGQAVNWRVKENIDA